MKNKFIAPKNANELNVFLAETLADIKNRKIQLDEAESIARMSDKINKNVLNQVLYYKASKSNGFTIPFLEAESDDS